MALEPGQGGVVGGTATSTGWSGGWHSYQDRVEWWPALEPGQGGVVAGTATNSPSVQLKVHKQVTATIGPHHRMQSSVTPPPSPVNGQDIGARS